MPTSFADSRISYQRHFQAGGTHEKNHSRNNRYGIPVRRLLCGDREGRQKLKRGQKVQVMEAGAIVREGKLKEVTEDQITIEVKKNLIVIPRVDVSRVTKKASKTPRVLTGLGIGAALSHSAAPMTTVLT